MNAHTSTNAHARSESNVGELRASPLTKPILLAYRALGGNRRRKVAGLLFDMIRRVEGGSYRSATMRKLLQRDWGVTVGAHSYGECMKPGVLPPGVTIGRYSSIGPGVRIYNQNHPIECVSTHPYFYDERLKLVEKNPHQRRALYVGHDVWIGANAIITPGCGRVGDGAVIGAGAVVTKDVPDFAVVAGSPAKTIRFRFSEPVCAAIKASRWWELPIEQLANALSSFLQPATDTDVIDALQAWLAAKPKDESLPVPPPEKSSIEAPATPAKSVEPALEQFDLPAVTPAAVSQA